VGLTWSAGDIQLTGAGGARRLLPDTASARTAGTYRGRLSWRPVARFGASIGYARAPFDDIASVMERNIDLETLEAGLDVRLARGLSLSAGGGGGWFSDGNHRTQAETGMTLTVSGGLFVGAFGRALSYERAAQDYFSPDRFHLLEGLAGYSLESGQWAGRLTGGLGGQQIRRAGDTQREWHVDLRAGRRWGIGNRVDLFGSVTNNASSSTTGAFRYGTAGVSVRIGMKGVLPRGPIRLEKPPPAVAHRRAGHAAIELKMSAHLEEQPPKRRRAHLGRERMLDVDGQPHAVRASAGSEGKAGRRYSAGGSFRRQCAVIRHTVELQHLSDAE
jgi:hypothetical protein